MGHYRPYNQTGDNQFTRIHITGKHARFCYLNGFFGPNFTHMMGRNFHDAVITSKQRAKAAGQVASADSGAVIIVVNSGGQSNKLQGKVAQLCLMVLFCAGEF